MTIFIGITILSIGQGGITWGIVLYALQTEILFFMFAFIMETLVIENIVCRFIRRQILTEMDGTNTKIMCILTGTVIDVVENIVFCYN